ncbi:MAG: hypothetical protein AB7P04_05100 [Bacteriovoracia bacterium]
MKMQFIGGKAAIGLLSFTMGILGFGATQAWAGNAEVYSAYDSAPEGDLVATPEKPVMMEVTSEEAVVEAERAAAKNQTPEQGLQVLKHRLAQLERENRTLRKQLQRKEIASTGLDAVDLAQKKGTYEPVASDQTQRVLARLDTVKQIVMKHGRAYDYRVLSEQELSQIQARLKAN